MPQRLTEAAESWRIVCERCCDVHESVSVICDHFLQTQIAKLTDAGADTGLFPASVTTGTPIQKASRLVVCPL